MTTGAITSEAESRSEAESEPAAGCEAGSEAGSEADAAQVHRRIVELGQAGQGEEALALIDPAVIDHRGGVSGDHIGIAAWAEKWEHMYDGLRDVTATIEQNVSSDELSTNRYTIRGTHIDSGRCYEVTGLDMVRVRNGRIIEHWALLDTAALQHQLTAGTLA
ncbi:ester cyclase [Actinospica robiniae]|uniref:ester cyclase n=1 Tax=Actinospica robiniae TaxID=304901 RepID=UPI000406BF21|nr:ester cyclase [Actinospica robiniae]